MSLLEYYFCITLKMFLVKNNMKMEKKSVAVDTNKIVVNNFYVKTVYFIY